MSIHNDEIEYERFRIIEGLLRELVENTKPASEGAKVETTADRIAADLKAGTFRGVSAFPVGNCPTCGDLVAPWNKHAKYEGGYTCKPTQPEPAAPVEMPHELRNAAAGLRKAAENYSDGSVDGLPFIIAADRLESWWRTHSQPARTDLYGYIKRELDDLLGSCGAIVALEGVPLSSKFAAEIRDKAKALAAKVEIADVSRRTGFSPPAAQPAPVRMTPELEDILRWQSQRAKNLRQLPLAEAPRVADDIDATVAAVRQQAEQAQAMEARLKEAESEALVCVALYKELAKRDETVRDLGKLISSLQAEARVKLPDLKKIRMALADVMVVLCGFPEMNNPKYNRLGSDVLVAMAEIDAAERGE